MNTDYKTEKTAKEYSELLERSTLASIRFNNFVDLLNTPLKGKMIVDLGCGDGAVTSLFAQETTNIIGVDSSPELIKQAKQNFPNIQFHCADICALGSKDNLANLDLVSQSFDLAIMSMVIPCMKTAEQVKNLFKAAALLLKPEGYLAYSDLHSAQVYTHENIPSALSNNKLSYSIYVPAKQKYNGMPLETRVLDNLTKQVIISFNEFYWAEEFLTECYMDSGFKKVKKMEYCEENKIINSSNNNPPFFEQVLLQKVQP